MYGVGFRVSGFERRVSGSGFQALSLGFRAQGFGFRGSGFELRVSGSGFQVYVFGVRCKGKGLLTHIKARYDHP